MEIALHQKSNPESAAFMGNTSQGNLIYYTNHNPPSQRQLAQFALEIGPPSFTRKSLPPSQSCPVSELPLLILYKTHFLPQILCEQCSTACEAPFPQFMIIFPLNKGHYCVPKLLWHMTGGRNRKDYLHVRSGDKSKINQTLPGIAKALQ